MAGSFCRFCDSRCFVARVLPDGRVLHMATCVRGAAHDRGATGYDFRTARNPRVTGEPTDQELRELYHQQLAAGGEAAALRAVAQAGASRALDDAAARIAEQFVGGDLRWLPHAKRYMHERAAEARGAGDSAALV